MEEQRQTVQDQKMDSWDDKTKREALGYTWEIAQQVRSYMSHAIEYANNCHNEAPKQFWEKLFAEMKERNVRGKKKKDRPIREKGDPNNPPPNPYRELDVQEVLKFLCFGDRRNIPEGEDDSQYFFTDFSFRTNERSIYQKQTLSTALGIRNTSHGHPSDQVEKEMSREELERIKNVYQDVTRPLERSSLPWRPPEMEDVADYWREVEKEITKRFEALPLSLEELGQELFNKTEADGLSPKEWEQLYCIAKELDLEMRGDMIYRQPDRERLLRNMRWIQLALNHGKVTPEAVEAEKERQRQAEQAREGAQRQMEEREAQMTAPLWTPVPWEAARALRRGREGSMLPLTDRLWQALLGGFQLLVDESIFLSEDGRRLLEKLQSLLTMSRGILAVDASVVSSIFRQYRSTKPYTKLELAEMEPEEREEMQQQREKAHKEAKTAIKRLRALRESKCLEVRNSPTDSRNSYDNIASLARLFPKTRFLVLTLDQQLAEELSRLKSGNAVAAKPIPSDNSKENTLLFYRATRGIYEEMLKSPPEPPRAPAPQTEAVPQGRAAAQADDDPQAQAGPAAKYISRELMAPPQEDIGLSPEWAEILADPAPQGQETPRQEAAARTDAAPQVSAPRKAAPTPKAPAVPKVVTDHKEWNRVLPVTRLPAREGEAVIAKFKDGSRETLRLGEFLNRGGEGSIYLTERGNLAAKIYLERHLTQGRLEKLSHMISVDPELDGLCWPQALLYNSKEEWVGFLMPLAKGKELASTVFTPGRDCINIKKMGWSRKNLAEIAGNIADLFGRMHKKGILMGDVNPRNFMVDRDCTVYFVDCDSYQFDDFPCPVFSPLFLPPEVHEWMRSTPGGASSSFIRTRDHELYSIAVLLFEILFLGKAPYESRNTNIDDVVQAIIDGNFPYPFNRGGSEDDDGDEKVVQRTPMQAPVGVWRYIWSQMPHSLKTDFYETFTRSRDTRLAAAGWAWEMRKYKELIEMEGSNFSDELMPTTFKVVSGEDGKEVTKMVDLVCEECGMHFNLAEEIYRRQKKHGGRVLCNPCRDRLRNFEERPKQVTCTHCGKEFQSTVAKWMRHEKNGSPIYCPDCVRETVICSVCGRPYEENRKKADRLREQHKQLVCPECTKRKYLQVTCSQCGKSYQDLREKVEQLQAAKKELLCPECYEKNFIQVTCSKCGKTYREHIDQVQNMQRMNRPILCPDCRPRRRI